MEASAVRGHVHLFFIENTTPTATPPKPTYLNPHSVTLHSPDPTPTHRPNIPEAEPHDEPICPYTSLVAARAAQLLTRLAAAQSRGSQEPLFFAKQT